ncbi:alanine--tRNA ligase [Flavisolibacter ginsenosidimutans]|uniref:Alanine--tRNA ligase n=1 Tax=Flavisolibacter ginsenosidimutans TaxID=661481 RepID=A0A5B8URI7_9BACT|nr:alanine--tRNA ligase [Flavisolibacter ginsenosidimutans]QEC58575.1 alanine--tRNA ligase [Flavisolibacter ginsenosidimutans]
MTSAAIRNAFLDFFRSKGHLIVPSAPIVVKNDPTLMFTNAGMNQFKDYFLGNKQAPSPRIADTQKCLRVSGKHNDLEEVGVDTYHHTMFEMLGNWSFGDYFKKEAIEWSWELLTSVLNIPKDRLYVTVFEGDEKEGLPKDEEAANEWKKWINEDRILLGNKKDNFWEMGDTGPCGPCTEIHVDTRTEDERKQVDGKNLVNADHPQVIEIWNNVFIQFNRLKDGSLQPLPAKHVDTGMGFERLVRVLQEKQSNYDTDVFTGTISKIEEITNNKYGFSDTKTDIAFRVLADHIRAISFTIADGQLPSNTGAGYVIRRILRRAVRYYYSYLNYQQPLLHQLLPVIATQFESVFPELKQQESFVTRVIKEEEEAFLRTLGKGIETLNEIISYFKDFPVYPISNPVTPKSPMPTVIKELTEVNSGISLFSGDSESLHKTISGKISFILYDRYGFPFDLIRLIVRENNFDVNEVEFNAEMQKQKERSRAATAIDTEDWIIVNEGSSNEFVGYDSLETKAQVLKYRKVKAKGKESYQIVLDKTPFYAESGGQVGDTGQLIINNEELRIVDTKKENDLIIHFAEKLPSSFDGEVIAKVDATKRKHTAIHHSATHLLHAALRKVLGTHVAQKGSLVNADYLRFDFSHFSKMTDEEIKEVERLVNEKIRENIPVVIRFMPKEEAMKTGAMALFGEKYGDTVRVVTIDPSYSVELCGGTHVGATGELGFFKITSEAAVAAGVRRIEAISGAAAENYINHQLETLRGVRELFKNPKDLGKAIASLQEENTLLKKQVEKFEAAQIKSLSKELLQQTQVVNSTPFIGAVVDVPTADALRKLAFELKASAPGHLIALASAVDGKAAVVLQLDEALSAEKNLDAAVLIKQKVSPLIKGGGGGQKTLATAGGQDASHLQEVIAAVKAAL